MGKKHLTGGLLQTPPPPTRPTPRHPLTPKVYELVLPNHDLLDHFAVAQLDGARVVKGGHDVAAQHQRQALRAVKVHVLNGHDAWAAGEVGWGWC
jgi:hypothetical protein